jgi:hypothetical protein
MVSPCVEAFGKPGSIVYSLLSTLPRKRLRRTLLTVVAYIAMAMSRFEAFGELITCYVCAEETLGLQPWWLY